METNKNEQSSVIDVDFESASTEVGKLKKDQPIEARVDKMSTLFLAMKKQIKDLEFEVYNNRGNFLPVQSEKQNEIRKALAKATSECLIPRKGMDNAHLKYSYASIDNLIDATYEALSANKIGITYTQIKGPEGEPMMFVEVTHWESGEYRNSTHPVYPTKDADRSKALMGGFTSAKRLFLSNLLGLGGIDSK